jgi:hypothetical protein
VWCGLIIFFMRKVWLFIYFVCVWVGGAYGQYAPQAGLAGSTAISAGSSQFVAWATNCAVQRGYMNIANPSLGYASLGDSSLAIGAPDHNIVSLGDSGVAVLTFLKPLYDGPGADFAVFENGFLNTANDSQAFLELAFVEVSSDGARYVRFPAASLIQYNTQIGNGDYIDASNLDNLAGKYVAMYGTPFDLGQLVDSPGLDVNHVTHVRLIDVVGSITGHASLDAAGRVINDPYPTPFPSCGFDLDAVGVINQVETGINTMAESAAVTVYPNPATEQIVVSVKQQGNWNVMLTSITGSVLLQTVISQASQTISMEQYPAGMYYLQLQNANGGKWVEVVTKR